ncbi:MAG: RidA family protein [Deltaproteobacteria bacterium]|nr:MAG: RidA family protein [Deltaproteobacteria bacterium]
MSQVEQRLAEMGITLPTPAAPAANYIPFRVVQNIVYISGQLPKQDGNLLYPGIVGKDVTQEEGYEAAKWCAVNLLAQLKVACDGDLDRVECVIKLGGFVQSTPDYKSHPEVINGASDLMVEVLGEAGRHARFAVGAPSLPRNTSVEIDGIFAIKG